MENEHAKHSGTNDKMAMNRDMGKSPYLMFAANLLASGLVMYFVMYTMIDRSADLYNNINNVYMTAMMVCAMAILMIAMMGSMFTDKRLNLILYSGFGLLFALAFAGMRMQALVGDSQFLRAMIPHHSGAVLMCERASLSDPEVKRLCGTIESSQTSQIDQMKAILKRL